MKKQVWLRGDEMCSGNETKCDQVIKLVWSRGNEMCLSDQTNAIRW
jgi:hypothetical protein